jgi:hypothetical protein
MSRTLRWLAIPVGLLLAASAVNAAGIEGHWSGTLDASGTKLRLAVHISKGPDGALTGTLDSLDQGATGLQLSAVKVSGDDVTLELGVAGAAFVGKLDAAGNEMKGEWRQGGAALPLTLSRAAAAPPPEAGPPATLAGFSDEATFLLFVNEERVGVFRSTWKDNGEIEANSTISLAGQTRTSSTRITPDADGRWKKIVMESAVGATTIERDGTSCRRTFKEETTTFTTRPEEVLFDNNGFSLMSMAVRRYDRARGGAQKLPLLILPGVAKDLTLEAKETAERTVGGRDLKLTHFVYGLPGVDIHIWVDDSSRLYFADIPAQNAAIVREGFEALRKTAEDKDPLLSKPEHEVVVDSNVKVPMRDGMRLATDIYRPKGVEKAPTILVRTPYKKEMSELQGRYYARRGFAFAIQDCRGRFSSEGIWEPFVNEGRDGHDTIEWLAKQPWSDGKIGMIGASYLGWVQWWAAAERPPHLVTIIPNVAPPDPFFNIPYEYGAFFLMGAIWWADVLESKATGDLSGVTMQSVMDKKYNTLLRPLPVIELDKAVLGKENKYWRTWIAHPTNDAYWAPANFLDRLEKVDIPVLHQSGWFDGDGIGSKLNYLKMTSHGHANQKLVLGPWGHTDTAGRMIGERDFGEAAIIDLQRDYLRWFDRWLKGKENGIDKDPLVSLFVMGSNKWLHGPTYPLPQTRFEKWYLSSGGQANTSKGDGKLTRGVPAAETPADRYTYDPGDPTPSPLAYEETKEDEKKIRSVEEKKSKAEGYHLEVTDSRRDILVYTTDALDKPLTIAGPLTAVLYAASSARDTDWFASLVELDKDGKVFPLVQGKLRARFRKSMSKPELLKPGKVYEYRLDLWHTGITIPAGSRLRVEISSAAFPLFSRNLNTGGHNETETKFVSAEQTIYHDAGYPSHVLLPVIPD